MKYMLVLQWSGSAAADLDALVEREDAVASVLGDDHCVDGHDIGSGEANIFIRTDAPQAAFDAIRGAGLLWLGEHEGRVAFRPMRGSRFTLLSPRDRGPFRVR